LSAINAPKERNARELETQPIRLSTALLGKLLPLMDLQPVLRAWRGNTLATSTPPLGLTALQASTPQMDPLQLAHPLLRARSPRPQPPQIAGFPIVLLANTLPSEAAAVQSATSLNHATLIHKGKTSLVSPATTTTTCRRCACSLPQTCTSPSTRGNPSAPRAS